MREGEGLCLFACSCDWKHAAVAPDWTCERCVEIVDGSEGAGHLAPVYGGRRRPPLAGEALLRVAQRVEDGELEIEGELLAELLLPYAREGLQVPPRRKGRKRGGPFASRSHCLAWLREHAMSCMKHALPITRAHVGQLGSGSKYLKTSDPSSAARTIARWCKVYRIDFDREVKNGSVSDMDLTLSN